MPLTPAEMVTIVADVLGLPVTTVKNYDRTLMEAGLRTKKGHGRGSALMGPSDVAVLLAAIASSDEIARTPECVQKLYEMPYAPPFKSLHPALFKDLPPRPGARVPTELSYLSKFLGVEEKTISTFGKAFVALMEHLISNPDARYHFSLRVQIEGLVPFGAGLIILDPKKLGPAREVYFFKGGGPIRRLMITRDITGLDDIAETIASRIDGKGAEAV